MKGYDMSEQTRKKNDIMGDAEDDDDESLEEEKEVEEVRSREKDRDRDSDRSRSRSNEREKEKEKEKEKDKMKELGRLEKKEVNIGKLSVVGAPTTSSTSSSRVPVKDIAMKQKAAGNFGQDVLEFFGKLSVAELRQQTPQELSKGDGKILDEILITVFVCKVLELRYADQKAQWELVAKKAMSWVKKEVKKIVGGKDVDINWSAVFSPQFLESVKV